MPTGMYACYRAYAYSSRHWTLCTGICPVAIGPRRQAPGPICLRAHTLCHGHIDPVAIGTGAMLLEPMSTGLYCCYMPVGIGSSIPPGTALSLAPGGICPRTHYRLSAGREAELVGSEASPCSLSLAAMFASLSRFLRKHSLSFALRLGCLRR